MGLEICRDYYNMHIRPLEAELLDIAEYAPELREKGARWRGAEHEARMLGLKHWLKEGFKASSFPAPSGLDGLRNLRRKKGVDSDRFLHNIKAIEIELRMQDTKVSRLELRAVRTRTSTVIPSAYWYTSKEAFDGSAISAEEWT